MVNFTRVISVCAWLVVLSASVAQAQDRARYRDYQLGSSLATIAKQTGAPASDVTIVHQRPALLQELEWRPPYFLRDSTRQTDPVARAVFGFYDDQLFSIVVDYDIERTAGLTNADLIDSISEVYGVPGKSLARRGSATDFSPGSDIPIAQWAGADYAVTLLKVAYPVAFRLTVVSPQIAALARTATVEAVRLNLREAPQREAARQKKAVADMESAQDKARQANKAGFKP